MSLVFEQHEHTLLGEVAERMCLRTQEETFQATASESNVGSK
jgi:hypothetical protein